MRYRILLKRLKTVLISHHMLFSQAGKYIKTMIFQRTKSLVRMDHGGTCKTANCFKKCIGINSQHFFTTFKKKIIYSIVDYVNHENFNCWRFRLLQLNRNNE